MSRRRQSKQLPARIPLQESLTLFEKGELPIDETITLTTADDFIKDVFSLPKDRDTEITFNQTHLRYCLYKGSYYTKNIRQTKGNKTDDQLRHNELNHLVGIEFFNEEKLNELISSPVAIIPARANDEPTLNRYFIVLNAKHNGSNICLIAEPYGQGTRDGISYPSMHITSIYSKENINSIIELEAKREAMAELILGHAIETGIKIPDELQNRPFYLNKEKAHLIDEYKTSLNILIDKNPTAKNAFDKYSKNVGEEIKKATKTANHEMQSSCPTALSSYADNLLLLTKDVKREKINFDKFDKDLKNNREDLFTHINQMLENDNTSDEILDRYTLTDYIASKLNVVGIKTYVIDDETIKNYAIIKNNSLNNSDYIPFNTLSQKEFYGFALGNQIYLKEDGIRADVLLHEYAHLFLNVFAKLHADEWKTIKASLKNDPDIIREINGAEYREKLGSKSEDINLTEYLCDKMAGHGVEALKNANIEDVINMATLSAIDVISPTLLSSERIKNLSTLMMSDLISGQFKKDALDLNTMNFKERGLFDDIEDDESNNTENDTDDSIEDHIKTEYVFEPKHDEKLENEIRQRLNLSDNVAVKVLDYTTVEADKVYLASKKTILDRPYPDYLPPLYGSQINPKKNFDIPAIPYENNIILWGKSDLTENITFYKLSPEVYTALCDYNITYFRALDERRIKDNQKVLDEIIDELNSKNSGDFIIKKETEKNTTLTIYQKKRALNFKYEMLNPNAYKPDRFAPHKYIKSFSLDPNKTLKDKDAVIIKYDNISNFSYTNHSDNIVGFLSENEFLFPKVYRQKRTPFVRKMYTTTYNRIKDLLVIFDNTDEINKEKVFTAWKSVRAILYQNRIDMSEQENNLLSSFQKGRETSYGNSNTKDTLLDKYGVLIKRQNGDEINEKETEELKNTLNYAYSVFGDLSAITKKHGIKVSHAGSVNMHASKAIGLWFPYYKAIGVSFKHEEEALSTTIHEFSHFVDYVRGQKTHHWHSSHIPGSDEYRIANTFRSITMPKGNYLCSSHECFARCMQLYADVKEFYNKHNEYSEENQAKEGMTHKEWRVQHEKITDLFKKEYPRYNAAFDSTGNIEIMLPAYHFTNEGDTKDYDNKDYDNYKLTKSYGKSLYSMCDEYIATIKEELSIKEFKAKTSTPSLLTLTNDEIQTLSECIKNKSDFVINNPNLNKPVHLVWGTMGDISQTKHGIAGYGLEHFIQRRYESDKKNADELTASILLIADAMKRATPTMHEESATKRNLIANGIKTIIDSVDKTKESNTELNHWKYISSMASEKYEAIKKEGKVAIQTVIAQYGFTQDFSEIRNQVVALITSIDRIREELPIVNDLYEKKSKKIIFLMGDVLNNPQKQLFDKTEQEYKENGVKVINALTIVNNIPGLAEIKKTKTRIGNIIPALRKALKNNDQISEIVFIPHEGEENKIEIDIKEYAAKHGIETTKFEVLENTQEPKKEEINNMDEEKEQVVNDLSIRASEAMSIRDKVKEVLRKTDEMMTREDRAILRQYEGVGGLKEEEATVEGALSEFYTPTPIVKKMWELMDAYNPDAYEVLEPTCGRGRFLDGRSDNHFTAYECDDTSARIAKILFPNADIRHDYFQKQFMAPSGRSLRKNLASNFDGVTLPANHPSYKLYDAVIGNPPYGQVNDIFKPFGMYSSPTITHTYPAYFIKEGLAHLKAGGFLAYIVPSTLYDAFIKSVSLHLDEYKYSYMSSILRQANANNELTVAFVNSRLVDAYRLPEGMFPSTRIGTDILVFKKETLKTTEYFSDYDDQKDSEDVLRFIKNIEEASEFFVNHPDHVLGDTKTRLGRYGKEETYIGFKEGETKEDVISKIMPIKELIRPRTREVINGKYEVDKITGEVEKEPVIVKAPKPIAWTKSQTGHVMSEEEFSSKYNINQDLSKEDKEIWKATKYDGSIDTNKLSPSALSHLRNTPSKYIETDKDVYCLKALYTTGNIYTKLDELENKKDACLIEDKYYTECHKLLKENIPEKIKIEDIHFSPLTVFATEFTVERNIEYAERIAHRTGPYYSSWQRRTINGYASETVYKEVPETVNLKTAFILWALNAKNKYAPYDETTARVKPEDFKTDNNIITWNHVEGYLNGVSIKPNISNWDTDEEKKEKERRAQSLKQDRRNIAEKLFDRFLHEGLTKEEQAALCDKYNKTFNAVVEPDYTKLPLYVSGMHSHKVMGGKDREFTMHPAQLRGVSFLTQKGAGLLAYDVGVGKTTAGIVATVMQLQSGRAKRPLIIVPKSVYNKWWEDIHQHFPDIEVNDLSNLDAEHAAPFLTPDHALNIKEGTISLMTYNGLSDHISFMDESIDENGILSTDLKEILSIKTTGTNREKSLELQKLNSRYGKCIKTKDERYAFFEKTGFDHITVDEAHNFKKLFTMPHADASESIEYKELAQPGEPSTRALKLYCACQLVQANNNDRNVFLLTATPFTNHPFEVFSMLSFMGRKRLRELQVNSIKAFTDKFASTKTDWGVNTSGNVEYITSMKEWRNLKELQGVLHEYFDRVTAEDAGIKRPNKIVVAPILETTPLQKEINLALEKSIINGGNKGEVLTAINNMRKCILSPSLITGSSYKDIDIPHMAEFVESSPKVKLCLDTVIKVYKKYPQGGQVIYCNLTGGNAAMKTYLRKNGIPEKAISIFEGGKRDEERQEKIEKFNNPSNPLKIIIGTSTIKEGVDLNGNSVALWNLTLDWNPSDITQVEGRAWRQGNKQNNVNIIYPLTYNSIDAFMYQKYDEKSSRINELFSYKGNSLSIEDINPMEMKYSLITDPEKRSRLIIDDKKKSIEMTISGYESEKIKYQKIITKFNREDEMRQKYETETAKYERLKEYNTTEAFVAKNLMNEAKRELDKLQKAKDTLHVYSVEEAQKFIDEIDTRIKAKGEELADVEKNIPEIIRQVKEEIARTKKPTRTVEEYSEDIAAQIIASANTNITSLQSESNENTNSQHPVLGNVEEPKIARSKIVKTNTEQKEPHKEEFLTSSEAIKRYGYKFNKKQMLGLKDQLFFAFLIDNKNEHYSGDKNISKALYTRLSRNMDNIVLVSDKQRLSLEKTLARVHGKVDLGNYRIYGWETKGKIFIAEDAISGNALLHEYTHLWSKAVQSSNPLLWEKIKQNVMQTNLFREMYNDERYKDIKHDIDNLCGETLSRLSGADNIARLEERRNSLMVNEYQQSDESTEEALSSLYGWLEEDVFNGYAHTLNLKEITTRILGDALEGKQTEQIQSSYKNQMTYTPNATFNKERALREGYTKLSPILLEQYFSVRSTITPRMKEHYIKHFKSLTKADPQKACEVLQDMVREEALSAHFFNKIRDENYPDKAFRKHFINAYNANAEEKFISLFKNGDSFRVINGVADNDVSSHYTNFKNFVLRDYLKNDNEIAKIVISSFIKSEKGDAVKLLYDACGENMDYRRKIRALLPEIEVEDTTHKTRHKVADTFGVINYDTNELLSSAYNTTYIDVNNIRGITSDLTLEERALVLSDDFKRNFGSIHRRDDEEIKALKQSGQYNKEEIKAMEWKEKHYFSDKNEIKPYVIKAIGNGYTLNSLYTNEQVKTAMEKLSAENKETFNKITKEEEVKNAFETTDKMTELKTEQKREQTAEKITAPKPEAQDNRYSIRHASKATVQINPLDKIRSVFNKNGINPPSLLVDGTIHRFDINKKGDKRGWYVLNSDYVNGKSIVYGAGGDWAGDSTVKVVASDGYMSATDNEAFKKRAEEEQRKKEEEREKEKLLARENASRYYSLSKNTSFPDEIPYLTEHGLTIEDALKNGVHYNSYFNAMQVPLYSNTTGELTTLQTISSSRNEESGAYTKMFLKGSDPNVHAIIGVPTSPLVFVCEGWATGVAIQKAVNDRVYAAMCCHNLQNTVEYIRKEHPDKFIVCIADNDSKKETPDIKGKGQIKAEESGADLVITIPNPKEDAADYALKADLRDFIRSSLTHSKEYREFLNNLKEQNEQKLQQKNEVKTITL